MISRFWLLALVPGAAAAQQVPQPVPTVEVSPTARTVVEKQLQPQGDWTTGRPAAGLTGPEASRIHDRFLESIGRTLETNRIAAGSPR